MLDPAIRWPTLKPVWAACEAFALPIAQGLCDLDTVERSLRAAAQKRAKSLPGNVLTHVSWTLRDAVRSYEALRNRADWNVRRAIAGLLDRQADPEQVRAAAVEANDALLTPTELDALIASEQAWWVRLHIAMGGEDDLAA